MKYKLFTVLFVIGFECSQNKLETFESSESFFAAKSAIVDEGEDELPWNYPMRYGMSGWSNLKTVEEQLNACNIPEEILK